MTRYGDIDGDAFCMKCNKMIWAIRPDDRNAVCPICGCGGEMVASLDKPMGAILLGAYNAGRRDEKAWH